MAANVTTTSSAVALNDTSILLASITNVTAGCYLKLDSEFCKVVSVPAAATTPVPVIRGQEGTAQVAHAASVQVLIGLGPTNLGASDFGQAAAGAASIAVAPTVRSRVVTNYAAAGAITLPAPGTDATAIIDGTGALAMTLANPSVLNDGDELSIIGNGKAAHTVTYTAGLGNVGATADVFTFAAGQAGGLKLAAAGGFWVNLGMVAGAATVVGPGIG